MRKTLLVLGLMLTLFSAGFAQEENKGKIVLKAGTEFAIEMQNTVDTKKSKIGEDVSFRMVEEVKGENASFERGTPVEGRLVNVQKFSADNGASKISLFFDFIKDDGKYLMMNAKVISVENDTNQIELSESSTFEAGTVLSVKEKDFQLKEGTVLRIKLTSDVVEKN